MPLVPVVPVARAVPVEPVEPAARAWTVPAPVVWAAAAELPVPAVEQEPPTERPVAPRGPVLLVASVRSDRPASRGSA